MIRNYVKLSVKVLLRRKMFTFISLFGIGVTLLVLMVVAALLDHTFAAMPPETRQDRTLVVSRVRMHGQDRTWSAAAGYELLDRHARGLSGVEELAILSNVTEVTTYPGGQPVRLSLKRTDGAFWRVLEFAFLDGTPYTAGDVAEARFVAVINDSTRRRLFGDAPGVGRTLEADGQRFRVVGVVADVPNLRSIPFADVWVPLTTAKSDTWRAGLIGDFVGLFLLRDRALARHVKEEWEARLAGVTLPDRQWHHLSAPAETRFESWARQLFGQRADPGQVEPASTGGLPGREGELRSYGAHLLGVLGVAALLFMLLPTVNLVNLNVSRIMERASEIGVRKAFGASARTLVGQFVVENVILTLLGGAAGLAISLAVLQAIERSGLFQYAEFQLNVRVFAYALVFSIVFGVVSGVYPAWRMSRLHPVEALRGGPR